MKKKVKYKSQVERIITNSGFSPRYGLSIDQVAWNKEVNDLLIENLKSLTTETKTILIEHDIHTVYDLKFTSLDFLLDMNDYKKAYFEAFQDCKIFLNKLINRDIPPLEL